MRRPTTFSLAALLLLLCGCGSTTATATLKVAQSVLSPYSFHVAGIAEGEIGVNSEYAAVDARVDVVLTYRGPAGDVPGAPVVVRWEKTVRRDAGQRAYRVVFGADGKFVTVVRSTWTEARASMPWLAPERTPDGEE